MLFSNPRRALASRLVDTFEQLEQRTLLAVGLDANGFTTVTPSSDTHVIYVSSSEGNDTNSGSSASTPVKTLGRGVSLLRSGSPDWVVLRKGDTWNEAFPSWTKSGKDSDEPMVISSYGSGADRPHVKAGAKNGFYSHTPFHDVAIMGIELEANTRNPDSSDFKNTEGGYGIQIVAPVDNFLVEDNSIHHFKYNVSLQGFSANATDITIRRNVITDAYDGHKSQGLYASMTDRLTIDGNVFDHNGWNEKLDGAEADIYSHSIYLFGSTYNSVVKNNIIANSASHGIQARGGGVIENNLFLDNPIATLLGGEGSAVQGGGIAGRITGNVYLGSNDTNGKTRGWAIELSNTRAGGNTLVSDNIIAHDVEKASPAIKLEVTAGGTYGTAVGLNDVTIEDNIVYKWYQGINFSTLFVDGATGSRGLNDLVVRDNDFQSTLSQKIINHSNAYNASEEDWSGNQYNNSSSASAWFSLQNSGTSFDAWKAKVESNASNAKAEYLDPNRTAATYNASIGGSTSTAAFLNAARNQSKATYNAKLTASAVIKYIRAGFGLASTSGGTSTPSVPSTPSTPIPSLPDDNDSGAPTVLSSAFSVAKQTIAIRFSEDVSGSLNISDLRIKDQKTNKLIPYDQMKMTYDKSTNTATWSFTEPVAMGEYTVMLSAPVVTDADGNQLDGDKNGVAGGDYVLKFEVTSAAV